MRIYLRKTNETDPYKNLSFMIFLSGTIFAVSYLVFGIMEPISSTLKFLNASDLSGFSMVLEFLKYLGMFLLLGYAFSGAVIFITYKVFTVLTVNLDEYEEIKNNNLGVAALISVLTIVVSLFTQNSFIIFIESFIPYPDIPNIM